MIGFPEFIVSSAMDMKNEVAQSGSLDWIRFMTSALP